jgi:hypothetical protein
MLSADSERTVTRTLRPGDLVMILNRKELADKGPLKITAVYPECFEVREHEGVIPANGTVNWQRYNAG